MEMKQKKTTESQKIRFYIMGLIYRNGERSVKVPSSQTLADQFGVARRTARIALEGLVREGWLIGKTGIGTFTNPAKSFISNKKYPIPLIGLIYGRGDNFFYDPPASTILSQMGLAAAEHNWNIRFFTRMDGSDENLKSEILSSNLNGLIWASKHYPAPEMLNCFRDHGIKIVTIDRKIESISSVCFDFRESLREIVKRLIQEKRRNLLLISTGLIPEEKLEYIQNCCKKENYPIHIRIKQCEVHHYPETLSECLRHSPPPDALVLPWHEPWITLEILTQHRIDFKQQCHLLVLEDFPAMERFPGTVLKIPLKEAAEAAGTEMKKLLEGKPPSDTILHAAILDFNIKQPKEASL